MGVSLTKRRTHVAGQRSAYAPAGAETGGVAKGAFSRPAPHLATLALQNGVDIKTVSGMLGHFSAGFTLDTYAHVTTSAKREAAKTMGNILSGAV